MKSATGTPSLIDGYAYAPDASKPAQLLVHFDVSPADGPYWVIELGPIVNGKYEYSIVSDDTSFSLYVLARDPENFRSKYEADVLGRLESYGFAGAKKPIATYQQSDCVYESTLRRQHIAKQISTK